MKELVAEILLRASKVVAAIVVGVLVYAIATNVLGAAGSGELAVLAFIAGAAVILLLESSPI